MLTLVAFLACSGDRFSPSGVTGAGGTSSSGGQTSGGAAGKGSGTGGSGVAGSEASGGSSSTAGGSGGNHMAGAAGAAVGGTNGGAGASGSSGAGGSSGDGGVGGAPGLGCPELPPPVGGFCEEDRLCTYGTHPIARCRDSFSCKGNEWSADLRDCATPPTCASLPMYPFVGASCSTLNQDCVADQNAYCVCYYDCLSVCSTDPVWHCFGPPVGCPPLLPNVGEPCTGNSTCRYGTCSSETAIDAACVDDLWTWQAAICPQ